MAKTNNAKTASKQAATTGAKVGKLSKQAASGQASKPAKQAKAASGQAAPRARSNYAGKSIKLLCKPADVTVRGGRAVRWAMVAKAKKVDDVLGAPYRLDGETEDRTFNSSNFKPFLDAGYIAIE